MGKFKSKHLVRFCKRLYSQLFIRKQSQYARLNQYPQNTQTNNWTFQYIRRQHSRFPSNKSHTWYTEIYWAHRFRIDANKLSIFCFHILCEINQAHTHLFVKQLLTDVIGTIKVKTWRHMASNYDCFDKQRLKWAIKLPLL